MPTAQAVSPFWSIFRSLANIRSTQVTKKMQLRRPQRLYRTVTCQAVLAAAALIATVHAQTLTTLVTFNVNNGELPSGLKQISNGNFYGTTSEGGANGDGEVFQMTLLGTLTILHSFDVTDGADPGGLTPSSGNYFGTTAAGGADNDGEVYEMTPTGTVTVLHSFDVTDGTQPGGLKQGSDGNFYGTTAAGGGFGDGEVFKMPPTGTLTLLHSFDSSDGSHPSGGLTQGTDGNYYGTTSSYGPGGYGTVFKITPTGTFTNLYGFGLTEQQPSGLLQSTIDGNFYGVTVEGGTNGDGSVYKITPSGTVTVIHSFNVTDGAFPAALILGTDGNFYGTTKDGGANGDGEVFKLTPSGNVTVLHSFDVTDGEAPVTLVQGFDGNFYGTTGGPCGPKGCGPPTDGSIYKLTVTHTLPGPTGITTLAGNGTQGYSGDGGLATSAKLSAPEGVAVDSSSNIYIADLGNNRIRKVTASTGIITTVAGNGAAGYSGDGGLATQAELNTPEGVWVDASGNIYIADHTNCRIRKVTVSTGKISTVAGNGTCAYSGDGGQATSAEISYPEDVTVDASGNIYIADSGNSRIRKVTVSTGIITTVAGDGTGGYAGDGGRATSAELNDPIGVGLDTAGNIYIGDFLNNRIRKVTVSTGVITTVAGDGTAGYSGDGGLATSAELHFPGGVEVDPAGNLYIADYGNSRIRKVSALNGDISTIAGNGTAGFAGDGGAAVSAEINIPPALALDAVGNIYIADRGNNRIRVVGY